MQTSPDAFMTTEIATWDIGGIATVRAVRIVCVLLNGVSLVRLSLRGNRGYHYRWTYRSEFRVDAGQRDGTVSESCFLGTIVSFGFGTHLHQRIGS